jgi:predicted ATP-dependent endonuclease of OLD family
MKIKKIIIKNYRGIKEKQEIPLSGFSSIVGKNDSGKSIILNVTDDNLKELLESKIKSKIKKSDGLDEFLNDILFDDSIIIQKIINQPGKSAQKENILIKDFNNADFSMLYTKSDEELNQMLEKYNITVPVEGKGRNSKLEKIKYIKKYCTENKIPETIRSISDDYKVTSLLPAVELFVSDYGLKADTSFKSHSVSEIQDYFSRETADDTKKLRQVEKEIQKEMNNEAEAIKNYMLDYTPSIKKVEIIPNIIWKDAIKSVGVSFQFDEDEKLIPMSHKGSGYRRLFMVARFRYLAEKNKGNNIIYLIEEPETFLHPSAQEDLLNSLNDLSEDNQIIITTHSPVFTGSTDYDSVILCKKEEQSIYEYADEDKKSDFIMHIVDELGIKPSYNLRDHHEKIVFVESKNDAMFYDLICKKFLDKNLLNNNKILVLPFGGGEDIESFINIDYFDKSQRDLFLIIDSEKHQNKQEKQQKRVDGIENYYHPRAFERVYFLPEDTFDFFSDEENARNTIKAIVKEKELKNIKEKNNIEVFEEMTKEEWENIVEPDLLSLLSEIIQ